MSPDYEIRPITIAESAMRAAKHAADTGERLPNPHDEGTADHRRWDACFKRAYQLQTSPESEGSA